MYIITDIICIQNNNKVSHHKDISSLNMLLAIAPHGRNIVPIGKGLVQLPSFPNSLQHSSSVSQVK